MASLLSKELTVAVAILKATMRIDRSSLLLFHYLFYISPIYRIHSDKELKLETSDSFHGDYFTSLTP